MYNEDAIVRDLEIMAGANNYLNWIFSQFRSHVGKRIIEIGAGIGNFTKHFLDRELVVAIDNYAPCVDYIKQRFSGVENVVPLKMSIDDFVTDQLSQYRADTIVCINVLEHVKDDIAALKNMSDILVPEGKLILLVPAGQFIYGTVDKLVGHYRRYDKASLKNKVRQAGYLEIDSVSYMNSIAPLGWFLNNRILNKKEESPSQVIFYDRFVVPWLRKVEQVLPPPFGLSLVLIARKAEQDRKLEAARNSGGANQRGNIQLRLPNRSQGCQKHPRSPSE